MYPRSAKLQTAFGHWLSSLWPFAFYGSEKVFNLFYPCSSVVKPLLFSAGKIAGRKFTLMKTSLTRINIAQNH
jgi:hypothetical protein